VARTHKSRLAEIAALALAHASAAGAGATARRRGNPVRWGGQNFSDPSALVAWINARGGQTDVPTFLASHPEAAAIFRGLAPTNAPAAMPAAAGAGLGGIDAVLPGGSPFTLPDGGLTHQLGGPLAFPPGVAPRPLGPPILRPPVAGTSRLLPLPRPVRRRQVDPRLLRLLAQRQARPRRPRAMPPIYPMATAAPY